MSKGQLYIFSGPSGSGKDTVLKQLLSGREDVKLSISSITRPMRVGEVEGEKYNFISREKFEQMLKNDELLEHNVYVGNYYGTPKKPVEQWCEQGYDVILEIDVNGALKVMEKRPDAISVFIMPPSMSVLHQRLSGRGTEDEETVKSRLKIAVEEISKAVNYDYIIVNDTVEQAVKDFDAIIRANALLKDKMENLIYEVEQDAESFNW
ncbi:MAG: guanylate kinase [Clostridia bacterium]|nr:guanylate kinase [Clostridia bacterium]